MGQVSIIIVNYNAGDRLAACVSSILETPDRDEIIVVDNGSEDESIAHLVARFGHEKYVRVIISAQKRPQAISCFI